MPFLSLDKVLDPRQVKRTSLKLQTYFPSTNPSCKEHFFRLLRVVNAFFPVMRKSCSINLQIRLKSGRIFPHPAFFAEHIDIFNSQTGLGDGWNMLLDDFFNHLSRISTWWNGVCTKIRTKRGSFASIFYISMMNICNQCHQVPLKESLFDGFKPALWIFIG